MLYSLIGLFHRKSILFDINNKSYKVIQRKFIQSQSQHFRGNSWVRSVWGKEMIQMCHGNSLPSVWEVPTYPAQFRSVWEKEMTATHSQPGLRPESQTGVGERTDNWGTDLTPFLESGAKPSSTVVCARIFHCVIDHVAESWFTCKAWRCYLQIWNYESLTDPLAHWLTGVTARKCYRI